MFLRIPKSHLHISRPRSFKSQAKRYTNFKWSVDTLNNLSSEQITSHMVDDTIRFLRENKVRYYAGINGLKYKPGAIHEIYCTIIKEDEFFINRVPSEYLADVFKEMPASFFTTKNLDLLHELSGKLYNDYFKHIPLYHITDINGRGWPGCTMPGYDGGFWRYIAPEITLVTNPNEFIDANDERPKLVSRERWTGPYNLHVVKINDSAILKPINNFICVSGDQSMEKSAITFKFMPQDKSMRWIPFIPYMRDGKLIGGDEITDNTRE